MPRYELRLHLPDRPGSFGAAADVLARGGADIKSLDIVDVQGATAIDQIVIEVDHEAARDLPLLLEKVEGLHVEVFRPVPLRPDFAGPLDLIEGLTRVTPRRVLPTLVDGLPVSLHVSWALVLAERSPQPRRLAASVGAPTLVGAQTPWLPMTRAVALGQTDDWVPRRWGLGDRAALAAAPLDDDGRTAVVVARSAGPGFRRRELHQLSALARVAGRLGEGV